MTQPTTGSRHAAAAPGTRPTDDDLVGWMSTLSNWGRWGPEDERGTLNLVTPATAQAGVAAIRTGEAVSCSIPIGYARDPHPVTGQLGEKSAWKVAPMHFMIKGGEESSAEQPEQLYGSDAFLIAPHGSMITHLDTPSHILYAGTMFNAHPASALSMETGAEIGGVGIARQGVVTRGVLLDIAALDGRDWLDDGEEVVPEQLEACEARQGVGVRAGDALLIRTGYRKRNPRGPATDRPGLQAACLPWLRERDVAVLGSDVTEDVHPHGYATGSPIHLVGIWSLGLWLLDNCDLERLAEACATRGSWEFLFVIAPLVLEGGTGSPVNPLAIL